MTTRPFEKILSIEDLKTTADRLSNYFFTPGALKFFNSRIDWKLFPVDGERGYFVTSEQYEDIYTGKRNPRYWTVRQYKVTPYKREDGRVRDILDIDRAGEFQTWASLEGARGRAEELQGYAMIDAKSFEMERDNV